MSFLTKQEWVLLCTLRLGLFAINPHTYLSVLNLIPLIKTLTRGDMSVKDVILIRDPKPDDHSLREEQSTSITKTNGHSSGEEYPQINARQRVIESALYFAACAEQGSEHPIAKGVCKL